MDMDEDRGLEEQKFRKKSILRVTTLEESLNSCCSTHEEGHSSPTKNKKSLNRRLNFASRRRSSGDTSCVSDLPATTHTNNLITSRNSSSLITKISSSQQRKTVTFAQIVIREYNCTIGDNPSCSRGAPISLHWSYNPDQIISTIDLYEKFRKLNPPRKRAQMLIPMMIRHEKLKMEWDVGTSEILKVIREIKIIQQQRYKSATQQDRRIRAEVLLENAKNSVRRLVVK